MHLPEDQAGACEVQFRLQHPAPNFRTGCLENFPFAERGRDCRFQLREQLAIPQLSPDISNNEMALVGAPAGAENITLTLGGFVLSKQRMEGLRWEATDVDWSFGSGPLVRGPAEAIVLVSTGRPAPLEELTGDGVAALTARLQAA